VATGERLFSFRGLVALCSAATLASLWDYGFEIRHDNLLLMGLLLTWCVVRVGPAGMQSYLLAGALAVALQFVAFKAFVYTVPLSVMVLVFPPPGHRSPRRKLAMGWITGAIGMFVIARLAFGVAGAWKGFLTGSESMSSVAAGATRFGPGVALWRLLGQTPLLLALLASALVALVVDLRRRGRAALSWDGNLPEALLFLGALTALLINPTPFPYNLLHLVPYAFLFAFRHAVTLWKEISQRAALLPVMGAVLIFTHLAPFGLATRRHLDFTNYRQVALMRLAEDLTDPAKDPVFDGIGMVPTRPIISPRSFLHSLGILAFLQGPGPQIRDLLAADPAAVIIPSYRTDWLPEADHDYIREHYVELADDFWVLGKVLSPGGGTFEIIHPGRYRIASFQVSNLAGSYPTGIAGLLAPPEEPSLPGTLDGTPLTNRPVELSVGTHRIETAATCQPTVVWVGPRLNRARRLGPGDHAALFVNW